MTAEPCAVVKIGHAASEKKGTDSRRERKDTGNAQRARLGIVLASRASLLSAAVIADVTDAAERASMPGSTRLIAQNCSALASEGSRTAPRNHVSVLQSLFGCVKAGEDLKPITSIAVDTPLRANKARRLRFKGLKLTSQAWAAGLMDVCPSLLI